MSPVELFYALQDNQVVRRVLAPFPPERAELISNLPRTGDSGQPHQTASLMLEWGCGGLQVRSSTLHAERFTLGTVVDRVVFGPPGQWEGDLSLLRTPIGGDVVILANASHEAYVHGIQRMVAELWPGENISLTARMVRRQVCVFSGSWKYSPVDELAGSRSRIELYHHELDADRSPRKERTADIAAFAAATSHYAGTEIHFECANEPVNVTWYSNAIYNWTEANRRKPFDQNLIFEQLAAQTGLTFSKQFRSVRRLHLEAV